MIFAFACLVGVLCARGANVFAMYQAFWMLNGERVPLVWSMMASKPALTMPKPFAVSFPTPASTRRESRLAAGRLRACATWGSLGECWQRGHQIPGGRWQRTRESTEKALAVSMMLQSGPCQGQIDPLGEGYLVSEFGTRVWDGEDV